MCDPVVIIGAGMAGSECAWQLARRGIPVRLYEMRPSNMTPAHRSGRFAELVCSNSFRSDEATHPAGLLKREMAELGSLLILKARENAVPAGGALAVDRERFSEAVTQTLENLPGVEVLRQEVEVLPEAGEVVVATGPLTSSRLTAALLEKLGAEELYFYDAIAPIVDGETLNTERMFWASRWDKGPNESYLNVPLTQAEYEAFVQALVSAEVVPLREFERELFFEGCLPIEEMARRGTDTLRHGPLKPIGLKTPDGKRPWAVVQLRPEGLARTHFNLVGFQTRLRYGEQLRVLRTLPGFSQAEFVRFGQVHRNTYFNSPRLLASDLSLKKDPRIFLAGQITGVEGYLESAASGLLVALVLVSRRRGRSFELPPPTTALGALVRHLLASEPQHFQPANVHFGLFEPLSEKRPRSERRAAYAERAVREFASWRERCGILSMNF